MRSFASIDRIEYSYAICEVELVEEEISRWFDYDEKDTIMVDVPLKLIRETVGDVEEGDVIVVELNYGEVDYVYCRDDDEKERRLRELNNLMNPEEEQNE